MTMGGTAVTRAPEAPAGYEEQRLRVMAPPRPERVTLVGDSLEEARLTFRLDLAGKKRVAPPMLVFEFARLDQRARSTSERLGIAIVRDFAHEWGPLGGGLTASVGGIPASQVNPSREPVSMWLEVSRLVRALLLLGQDLRAGRRGGDDEWKVAERLDRHGGKPLPKIVLRRERFFWLTEQLLSRGNVRPRLSWLDNPRALNPTTDLDGDGLVAPLAAQLLLAVSSPRGVGRCGHCGHPFLLRPRQGNAGVLTYCLECGIHGAWSTASARYRAKNKNARARR